MFGHGPSHKSSGLSRGSNHFTKNEMLQMFGAGPEHEGRERRGAAFSNIHIKHQKPGKTAIGE